MTASPHSPALAGFHFQNTYARLPERFFAAVKPSLVSAPRLIQLNRSLAADLQLDPDLLATPEGLAVLAGNRIAEGSEPLAMAYAGHQFGNFVPQLGDGRAILLGEVLARDGRRFDVQLKGSGRTPYSRGGDGRAALGPVLREYILSESMAALGVPTTRALAAVLTGDPVFRESALPGAVLTRVAASHLRVGTFQFFAARRDVQAIRILADYAMRRHYPDAAQSQRRYRAFLDGVIARQAHLVAQWMLLGFIHGVLNTDNTSISGETIDFGPCAFMEAFDPEQVFSSIDHASRYSYSNQSHAMHWNMARLAEAMLPLLVEEEGGDEEAGLSSAREAIDRFVPQFELARAAGFQRKLGLARDEPGDNALAEDLLDGMFRNQADFTLTFRRLCDAAEDPAADAAVRTLFNNPGDYEAWAERWRQRLERETIPAAERATLMRAANPAFIPRNHMVQAMIEAAVERDDFRPFENLLDASARPYEDRPELARFTIPARPEERVRATFCGT